jgi:ABC-type Zn uptake system ZnuABC Zn-binding protein ZnuA
MRRDFLLGIVALAALFLTACGQSNGQLQTESSLDGMVLPEVAAANLTGGEKLAVVATTNIIGDVVANVGGKAIDLTVLTEIGQDPHSFEPTPQELAAVEDADLVFVNGLGLEEVLMSAVENVATGPVVPVSAGIKPLAFSGEENHGHEHSDPHFWVDPNNVMVWVENIAWVLSQADPANQSVYEANAAAYLDELNALDAYIRQQTARIPEGERKLVTDHDLYGYFAEEYGFEIIGTVIPSFTSTAGASAGDVAKLVGVIEAAGVPAVFIGATASQGTRNLAEALAKEAGSQVRVLPLLSGSLAPAGQSGDTYLGYMRYNIDQIVLGLTGQP